MYNLCTFVTSVCVVYNAELNSYWYDAYIDVLSQYSSLSGCSFQSCYCVVYCMIPFFLTRVFVSTYFEFRTCLVADTASGLAGHCLRTQPRAWPFTVADTASGLAGHCPRTQPRAWPVTVRGHSLRPGHSLLRTQPRAWPVTVRGHSLGPGQSLSVDTSSGLAGHCLRTQPRAWPVTVCGHSIGPGRSLSVDTASGLASHCPRLGIWALLSCCYLTRSVGNLFSIFEMFLKFNI